MSTLAQITAAIDDDIRNKTPLVLKVEHADVEQLITDEMFPDSVKVEWNGSSAVDPITDIVCNPSLTGLAKCTFKVWFYKKGNTVEFFGFMFNTSTNASIGNFEFILFPTTLYRPLLIAPCITSMTRLAEPPVTLPNAKVVAEEAAMSIYGDIPVSIGVGAYRFNGFYKVTN